MTTVDSAGTPQPAPVWFLWRPDSTALLYSQPTARKLARLATNPAVTLHLNDDGEGHDFAVLTGVLTRGDETRAAHEHPDYLAKYADLMARVFGAPTGFSTAFSVPLVFHPHKIRGI
ncbi:pyridoxamine 5'-phosphate oxidase family protein [Actinokineospora sp. G85]|uniref:pyridoxamine 5'-phosphate oxidase family protein n=1 Tax=Actinokineospora sp. G85 TaxID=3406626 RepID=UPI003C78307C